MINSIIGALQDKSLIFTVTAGRSGTKLLTTLLKDSLGISAEHEPVPRVNFVMRSIINAPEVAKTWLLSEKLPAILASANSPIYIETSHLFCKGFIEPMLELGLRPKFIILKRPAIEVAESFFYINSIPERTSSGRLVLLGPSDPGVLHLPNWEQYSDFQLCYWYALEIERRQKIYSAMFEAAGLDSFNIDMASLTDFDAFKQLSKFVVGDLPIFPDEVVFRQVISTNQNPRSGLAGNVGKRSSPRDLLDLAQEIDEVLYKAHAVSNTGVDYLTKVGSYSTGAKNTTLGLLQVFWATGEGENCKFSESDAQSVSISIDGVQIEVCFSLPAGLNPARVRLDPIDRQSVVTLGAIKLINGAGNILWRWDGDLGELRNMFGMVALSAVGGRSYVCVNNDPQFEFSIPSGVFDYSIGVVKLMVEIKAESLERGLGRLLKFYDSKNVQNPPIRLVQSIDTLSNLIGSSLASRDQTIAQQRHQLNQMRIELLRAEAQLDLLKDLMLGSREDERL